MKKYLFILLLFTGLVISPSVFGDEDVEDLKKLAEQLQDIKNLPTQVTIPMQIVSEDDDEDDDDGSKGSRSNPYTMDETATISMTTGIYGNKFDDKKYDSLKEYLIEGRTVTFEGSATIEITEVLRGEDVVDFITDEPYEYLTDPLEGYEWALISFSFDWLESDDKRPQSISRHEFVIYEMDGTLVDNIAYFLYYDDVFKLEYFEVGDNLSETVIKLVPRDEPFLLSFGGDIVYEQIYFELE